MPKNSKDLVQWYKTIWNEYYDVPSIINRLNAQDDPKRLVPEYQWHAYSKHDMPRNTTVFNEPINPNPDWKGIYKDLQNELSRKYNIPYEGPIQDNRGYKTSATTRSFDYGNFVPAGINAIAQAYDSFQYNTSASDLMRDAGSGYSQAGGSTYVNNNYVNKNEVLSETDRASVGNVFKGAATGAAAGAMLGPVGAAIGGVGGALISGIGGLFRHSNAKDEIRKANAKITAENNFNRAYALTQGARDQAIDKYGMPGQGRLFTAVGKDKGMNTEYNKMTVAQTPRGFEYGPLTAYGQGGEVVGNPNEGDWNIIKGDAKDNKPLSVKEDDVVLSKRFGLAQKAAPAVAAIQHINRSIEQLQGAVQQQKNRQSQELASKVIKKTANELQQQKEQYNEYLSELADDQAMLRQNGYLPDNKPMHMYNGWDWGNFITGLTGGLTGLSQYFGASRQKVKSPNTYFPNKYAPEAFNILRGLRTNIKPQIDAVESQRAATDYAINNSGGLGTGQKMISRLANSLGTAQNKANIYAAADNQDNSYKSALGQYMLTSGAQEASNMMQAGQWDLDYYSKAHAAKLKGQQMGVYNWLNALQQYVANANKLGMFRDTYGLYAAGLSDEARKALKDWRTA